MSELIIFGISLLLGLTLLIAGILKALRIKRVQKAISDYKILPPKLTNIVTTFLVIPGNIITGILLLSGFYTLGSILAFVYFFIGNISVGYVLYKRRRVEDCGCYGTFIKFPITKFKYLHNLFWLSLSAILLILLF